MNIKLKKLHKDAVVPKYAHKTDAGMDLTAVSVEFDSGDNGIITYNTGISIEIPDGYVGLIYPRSSIYNKELYLSNSVGVIDSGYRGEIKLKFCLDIGNWWSEEESSHFQTMLENGLFYYHETAQDKKRNISYFANVYAVGDRIGQIIIMPIPKIKFVEANELEESDRGESGHGSTGR